MKEVKKKHSVWLSESAWADVEHHYQADNCSTKNEYIEKAIQFYSGYLDTEHAEEYLPRVLSDVLEGKLGAFGKRMGHLLFKQAVDQDLMANLLASDTNETERLEVKQHGKKTTIRRWHGAQAGGWPLGRPHRSGPQGKR